MLKQTSQIYLYKPDLAAAFGRLCVETANRDCCFLFVLQPPSGGCVLKRLQKTRYNASGLQPPSGGCVLKQWIAENGQYQPKQPPSGGCVLKPYQYRAHGNRFTPATFGGYTLKQILINLNSIIFTFLLYLSTRFIPNNIPPCISPLFTLDYAPFLAFIIYNYACF